MNHKPGFTLLEVLVSFALLSGLLALLLQSQGQAVFFIARTQQTELVQAEAMNRLLAVERAGVIPNPPQGEFPPDHPLAGGSWRIEQSSQDFLGFSLTQIICHVSYLERGSKHTYSTSILGDLQ